MNNKKQRDNARFQVMILTLDPQCMCPGCQNESAHGHHIIYKSKWSSVVESVLGFGRDSNQNGIGLCAVCHYKAHNGCGINGKSGREFMFDILNSFSKDTGYYYRFLKIKNELKKSLIRKGVVK